MKVAKSFKKIALLSAVLGVSFGVTYSYVSTSPTSYVYALDNLGNKNSNNTQTVQDNTNQQQNQQQTQQNQQTQQQTTTQDNTQSGGTSNLSDIDVTGKITGNQKESGSDHTNINGDGGSITDQFKNNAPIKSEDLARAKQQSSWITNLLGLAVSTIFYIILGFVSLVTVLDLGYLYVPFIRPYLYTAGTDGTGGFTGQGSVGGGSILGKQWVSDEAVQVASMLGGSAQATGHGGGFGGGGFGGGGFGGGGFGGGGFGAQPQQTQEKGGKSVAYIYLKKRIVALIFLGVAAVLLLFTSVFTDFGFNIGGLIFRIIDIISGKTNTV